MKKVLCILMVLLLLLLMSPLPALGADLTDGPFTFTLEDGGAVITGYTGTNTELTVPNTLSGYSVIAIGDRALAGKKDLISVTMQEGIKVIGDSAFDTCSGLESVILPKSLTIIGKSAFSHCEEMDSITLPDSLISIGGYAFSNCKSLTSITVPNGVTEIKESVFAHCAALDSITLHESLLVIGDWSFEDCAALDFISIPDSVTSIGTGAFIHCESLNSISIPNGVTIIKGSTFLGCKSIASINIPDGVTRIGGSAFSGCEGLTSVMIPDSVIRIGESAFSVCKNLVSVKLSELTLVGKGAFDGCPRARFSFYGETSSMGKLPMFIPWTVETLRSHLGTESYSFIPAHPLDNACLLVVDGDSHAVSGNLTDQADAFRYTVIGKSGEKLRFSQDPDNASILVKMYVSYPSAGRYYGGSSSVNGYNCVVNLSAVDMRTHITITTATAGSYLGNVIFFLEGQTSYYSDFPNLETAQVQAFVNKIVQHVSAP